MNFEDLLKILQEWTNNVPLIVLGSGSSIPYGLPSMWELGEHLKKTLSFTDSEDLSQLEEFTDILDELGDLEGALLKIQPRENVLFQIVCETWNLVNEKDLETYDLILKGKCDLPLADLLKHLLTAAKKKVSIVTTNYDRLAEYAASLSEAFICTGYSQDYIGHFSKHIHKNNIPSLVGFSGQVNLWKVHGSLDWFKDQQERDVHLPLRQNVPESYIPSIVTPGLSKYFQTQLEPFRTIFTEADEEIENSNGYLCIGYGFNDIHVQPKLVTEIRSRKPIIVLTKKLTDQAKTTVVDSRCENYIVFEEGHNAKDTNLHSSIFGNHIIPDASYWQLSEYLKLIKS